MSTYGYYWNGNSAAVLKALQNHGRGLQLTSRRYDNDEIWGGVLAYLDFLGAAELPELNIPAATEDAFFRIFASILFSRGRNLAPLLRAWHAARSGAVWFSAEDEFSALEYIALCAWTGHRELLDIFDAHENDDSDHLGSALCGVKAFLDGDMAEAYRMLAFLVDIPLGGREELMLSTPAIHELALLVTVFHKASKTRIVRLASKLCSMRIGFADRLPEKAGQYCHDRMFNYCKFATVAGSPMIFEELGVGFRRWNSPTAFLANVVEAITTNWPREKYEESVRLAMEQARAALREELPLVASAIVSAFAWVVPETQADELNAMAEGVKAQGGAWFRPYAGKQLGWKKVIEELDRSLPAMSKVKRSDANAARQGRIVWALAVQAKHFKWGEEAKVGDLCDCTAVIPCFRGPRGGDDGSSDRVVSYKTLGSAKYALILSDLDNSILKEANRNGMAQLAGVVGQNQPAAMLELMCDLDVVTLSLNGTDRSKWEFMPISLHRADIPLAVKTTEEGGMEIEFASWCQEVEGPCVLRKADEREYAYYVFSKDVQAVLGVFRSFGTNCRLQIPAEGVGQMRELLPRLGTLAPIQGDLKAIGSVAGMERVSGDPVPVARLEFKDGVLRISLRTRPLAGDFQLVFFPGEGQPERMVTFKLHTAVLVRDLAAERQGADKVRQALAEFETWREGENEWVVDSLGAALKALAALKDMSEAVRLEWREGRRISVAGPKKGSWQLAAAGGTDLWFSVQGEFALDDGRMLTLAQLLEAVRNRVDDFVPFGDGEYLRLTRAMVKRLEALDSAGKLEGEALTVPTAAVPMLDGVFAAEGTQEADEMPLPELLAKRAMTVREAFAREVAVPPRLKAQLRPYQREGFEWLSRLASCGFGACLADDMGLGKTVQVIALLLERAQDGASLVVAPASVCGNWRKELERFAPTLHPVMAWDEKADQMDDVNSAGAGDVVIAGYGLLVSRERQFAARDWNVVVLDEAQAIKNEASKRAHAAKRLKAHFRVAATGTPIENRLAELWSIFDYLNPGLLGSLGDFSRKLIENGRASSALKRLVSPLILRRVKRDVLEELPEKTEINLPVILGEKEREGYETCRLTALAKLKEGAKEDRFSILAELTRLRRYCCHPSLVLGEGVVESAKMSALLELLEELRANNHRALVFSQFTDYLALVRTEVAKAGWTHQYLDGQTPTAERERLVNDFQRGVGDFFLISLKAGGTGLNLTAANYVILLDPWWNPAVENQAADRVHRIGQKQPVTVYRLVAADTVEEHVLELHSEKRALAEDVLDGTGSSALTQDQLMGLFA